MDDPFCTEWLAREQSQRERVSPQAVAALAATLDIARVPTEGEPLPPGWQWLFFNPVARASELGEDGHPRRTRESFLPPIELPRRMWAGSRLKYLAPLPVGSQAERRSRIASITPKEGRSGRMCFVTVEHVIAAEGRDCIVEEQDIVYREASSATAAAAAPAEPVPASRWREPLPTDPVLLFRYSALTFNGHRIHYDQPYAQQVEHYRGLVVHGPLLATLLQGFAMRCRPGEALRAFEFKGVQPLIAGDEAFLCADESEAGGLRLSVRLASGATTMQADASFG